MQEKLQKRVMIGIDSAPDYSVRKNRKVSLNDLINIEVSLNSISVIENLRKKFIAFGAA